MLRCTATKRDGERCTQNAGGLNGLCWRHDPANAAQRRRTAAKGGRGKPNPETRAVKTLMDTLTSRVLSGEVEPKVANAVVALQNVKLRALEIEKRLDEVDVRKELEELKVELGLT
jgi:hypothetical protein